MDRASEFALIKKANSKRAEAVTEATIILLQPYLDKTLTRSCTNSIIFQALNHLALVIGEIEAELDALMASGLSAATFEALKQTKKALTSQ